MKRKKYYKILERLNVLNYDDGIEFTLSSRLDRIAAILSSSDYSRVNSKGLFHLYSRKPLSMMSGPVVVLSTHVDCEKKITQCFSEMQDGGLLRGTYDNSITNAAAVCLMLEGGLADHVVVAFTGNEEVSSIGALQLSEYLQRFTQDVAVIVLDVSYEGYQEQADYTIENHYWTDAMGRVVTEVMRQSGYAWSFVPQDLSDIPAYIPLACVIQRSAEADEARDYKAFFPCFSFCLPVGDGEMHDNRGVTARQASYLHYMETLQRLANTII